MWYFVGFGESLMTISFFSFEYMDIIYIYFFSGGGGDEST